MQKSKTQAVFLGTIVLTALAAFAYFAFLLRNGEAGSEFQGSSLTTPIPFDGQASYEVLKAICDIGPRPSGSAGMAAQQKMLTRIFTDLGGRVSLQQFEVRHPVDGSAVTMSNMIVQWHPERAEKILLCAHYDTRPYPDADPVRPRGRFIGANDGASGAALLCALGQHMPELESRYGVDFVLFDGEEFIFDRRRDTYFLGSTYFARQYVAEKPKFSYKYGVLLDMVADRNLNLYMEKNSIRYARPIVLDIWNTARKLGVTEFIQRSRHEVRDDHLPLNNIAKIPTCDIIDFDYPRPGARQSYWHTESDIPENCSAESLAKVGWVLLEWLKRVE